MTLPVVWLPEANAKLQEAQARYQDIRPDLGLRFVGIKFATNKVRK